MRAPDNVALGRRPRGTGAASTPEVPAAAGTGKLANGTDPGHNAGGPGRPVPSWTRARDVPTRPGSGRLGSAARSVPKDARDNARLRRAHPRTSRVATHAGRGPRAISRSPAHQPHPGGPGVRHLSSRRDALLDRPRASGVHGLGARRRNDRGHAGGDAGRVPGDRERTVRHGDLARQPDRRPRGPDRGPGAGRAPRGSRGRRRGVPGRVRLHRRPRVHPAGHRGGPRRGDR